MKYKYLLYKAVKSFPQSDQVFYWLAGGFKTLKAARDKASKLNCFNGCFYIRRCVWGFEPDSECVFFYFNNGDFVCKTVGFRAELKAVCLLD